MEMFFNCWSVCKDRYNAYSYIDIKLQRPILSAVPQLDLGETSVLANSCLWLLVCLQIAGACVHLLCSFQWTCLVLEWNWLNDYGCFIFYWVGLMSGSLFEASPYAFKSLHLPIKNAWTNSLWQEFRASERTSFVMSPLFPPICVVASAKLSYSPLYIMRA